MPHNYPTGVTIVILSYNDSDLVGQTIASALTQVGVPLEVVVFADCPSPDFAAALEKYRADPRLRLELNARNLGVAGNYDRGIDAGQASYIVVLEAGDVVYPGHLSSLFSALELHPGAALAYTQHDRIDRQGIPVARESHAGHRSRSYFGGRDEAVDLLIHGDYINPSAAMLRRSVVDAVRSRDGQLFAAAPDNAPAGNGQFRELWTRIARSAPDFVFLHQASVGRRGAGTPPERSDAAVPAEKPAAALAASPRRQEETKDGSVKVSVGLITYNQPSYIREAIESIFAQTYPIDEFIISDDCSTEHENWELIQETIAACQARPNKVGRCIVRRNERNLGLVGHINRINELASNELFVYQAGDDIALPRRVELLVEEYERAGRPRHFLCHSSVEVINADAPSTWRPPVIETGLKLEEIALAFELHIGATAAYSRPLFDDFGPIVRATYEDLTLGFRAALMDAYHYIDQPLLRYRLGGITAPKPEDRPDAEKGRRHVRETLLQRAADAFQAGRLDLVELISRAFRQYGFAIEAETTSPDADRNFHELLIEHRLTMHEAKAFDARFAKLGAAPSFEIVVVHNGDEAPLVRTFTSAGRWLYDRFHLTVLSTVDAPEPDNDRVAWTKIAPGGTASYWPEIARCVETTAADWVIVLEAGDELVDHGLLYFAERAVRTPESVVIYADEGTVNAEVKPDRPYLKPDFSPDYFLARNYLGDAVVFKRSAALAVGGLRLTDGDPLRGLLLRIFSRFEGDAFGHLADVLLHRNATRSLDRRLLGETIEPALREVLPAARIAPGRLPGGACIDYPVEPMPSVLMIADACADLSMVRQFIEQTWLGCGHDNVELALFAAADLPEEVTAYLHEIAAAGHRGLKLHFACGSSEGLPAAIAGSSAELMLFARPGIAATDPAWIERIAGLALRANSGVVAPRLVGRNGRLIGNALLLGMEGFAVALGHGEIPEAPGYFGRLQSAQNPSALTPEVAMISRATLAAAGGLDAALGLTAALIDLCLRCKETGRDNLWTPDITMSCRFGSPGKIEADEETLLLDRWLPQMARDPAYNINLSRKRPFALHEHPQVSKLRLPWKPLPRLMALPGDHDGCGYHRVIDPFTATREAGLIDGCLSPGHYGPFDLAAFEADTIFVQRQFTDAQIHHLGHYRRFSKAKVVYELDDLATKLPATNLFKAAVPKDITDRLRKALGLCDRLVVTTDALKEAYRGMIADIRVVPNYVDRGRWEGLAPRRRIGAKPRVGWAGGASHTGDLALLVDLVKATADEVDWIFFGFCIDEIKPYVKELHAGVAVPDYPAKLAALDLDLAVAPLAENAFNDCKSNLKLLEYGILGYPVIASDFGPYRRSQEFPVTLVKNRQEEWLSALRSHIHDLDAAAQRGDALREHVGRHWILQDHVDEWQRAWFDFPA
jgi:glycosyltransferase involved in cell wall biosynthesis